MTPAGYADTAAAVRALATGILATLPTQRRSIEEPDDLAPPRHPDDIDEAAVLAAMHGPASVTRAERVEAIRRLNRQGLTDPRIAARMRLSRWWIRELRRAHGIPPATKGTP